MGSVGAVFDAFFVVQDIHLVALELASVVRSVDSWRVSMLGGDECDVRWSCVFDCGSVRYKKTR